MIIDPIRWSEVVVVQCCVGFASLLLATGGGTVSWDHVRDDGAGRWRIDPSVASEAELRLLPGIGAKRSSSIIETRTARGSFTLDNPLVDVPGLGPGLLRRWTESDLLDGPAGVTGVRMTHEP